MTDSKIAALHVIANRKVEANEKAMAKWIEDVQDHSRSALEWADSMFLNTAYAEVWKEVGAFTRGRKSFLEVRDLVSLRLVNEATSPSRSTSDCHNIMARAKLAAWGDVQREILDLAWEDDHRDEQAAA
ncbi:hypothetical protein BB934_45310 (plasmid) [Microvirga ossetica]|uniref:Uncharacterized protein n=1 Tax=Microvirga ossetica TaxID=1882682 RepID=A0A1B2EZM3_9HYPH|nr:hypothetical protein [Microvirga ossetica]ANY85440.1 hypothetical protein BB934_45310 [Microvirga ossetica]